jgi:Zn-dependent protease
MGGLCSSVRDPRPVREIIILAAGPAVSFILAAIGWYGLHYLEHHHPGLVYQIIDRETGEGRITLLGHALWICFSMNLILGIFNSIPIYPLDGGQIVHNILLIFLRDRVANRVALVLAFVFAVVFLAWSYHRSGEIDPYTCILVGWLLFNANRYLA